MLTLWHAEVPCYVVCMRFGIFLVSFNHVYDTLEFRGLILRRVFLHLGIQKCSFTVFVDIVACRTAILRRGYDLLNFPGVFS